MKRFQYWRPWGLTRPWKPRFERGCDEFHNKSVIIGLPFIGALVVFWERKLDDGEEHVCSYGPSGYAGVIKADCLICCEIVGSIEIDSGRIKYQTLKEHLGDEYMESAS